MSGPTDEDVLHWLRTVPGYRELIKQRISDARKVRVEKERRVLGKYYRIPRSSNGRECSIEDCDGKHYARGWCRHHYMKFRKAGVDNLGREVEGCG